MGEKTVLMLMRPSSKTNATPMTAKLVTFVQVGVVCVGRPPKTNATRVTHTIPKKSVKHTEIREATCGAMILRTIVKVYGLNGLNAMPLAALAKSLRFSGLNGPQHVAVTPISTAPAATLPPTVFAITKALWSVPHLEFTVGIDELYHLLVPRATTSRQLPEIFCLGVKVPARPGAA